MPARPKKPLDSSNFPSFDDLAADARDASPEDPYLLPIGDDIHEITLDADRYMVISRAQIIGDYESMFAALFTDPAERAVVRAHMKGKPPQLVDRLVGNVLSYFYGNGLQIEAGKGNSPAS
jgi:hypothetical protein